MKNKVKGNTEIQLQDYQTFKKKKKKKILSKFFLKNNNETNKQEQDIRLNPKKNLCMETLQSKTVIKNPIFHKIR